MSALAEVFLLQDPELYMPAHDDAALSHAPSIIAVGTFQVTVASPAELLAVRTRLEAGLESLVEPHQRAVVAPTRIVREWTLPMGETLTIYGDLYSPEQAVAQERDAGAGPDEAAVIGERVRDALTRGWFWGRFYSSAEPDGELGCIHRASIDHVITADEFTTAQAEGWPA